MTCAGRFFVPSADGTAGAVDNRTKTLTLAGVTSLGCNTGEGPNLPELRIFHAVVTIVLTLCPVASAIVLWRQGAATTGDVVLACTLALSVPSATRDLAVAHES